jgi:hypothetical protein
MDSMEDTVRALTSMLVQQTAEIERLTRETTGASSDDVDSITAQLNRCERVADTLGDIQQMFEENDVLRSVAVAWTAKQPGMQGLHNMLQSWHSEYDWAPAPIDRLGDTHQDHTGG